MGRVEKSPDVRETTQSRVFGTVNRFRPTYKRSTYNDYGIALKSNKNRSIDRRDTSPVHSGKGLGHFSFSIAGVEYRPVGRHLVIIEKKMRKPV